MKKVAFLTFVLFCGIAPVVGFGAEAELEQTEIAAFLERIEGRAGHQKPRKITFREQRFSPLLRDPVVASGNIWFVPPGLFRREVTEPEPSTILSNGKKLWMVYPDFQEVEEYSLDAKFPFAREMSVFFSGLSMRELSRNFRIRAWGDGGRVERMELRPRGGGRSGIERILVLLGEEERPRKLEIYSGDGSRSVWEVLKEDTFVPEPSFFELNVPAHWEIRRPLEKR